MILVYYFDDDDVFEYEVDYLDVRSALKQELDPKEFEKWDEEYPDYETEVFYDLLWEVFYEKAREEYNETIERERDPLGAVGMSEKDFY